MRMKQLISSLVVGACAMMALSSAATAADMTGAGATFPYPIYAKWAETYKASTGNGLNYQSVGSGAGIKQIKAKTVDFGASDAPMKAEDLDAEGLMQFPAIMGGVVTVVNVPGLAPGQLKLTGPIVADIYLGKITKWNDPQIVAANPDLKLTDTPITVVVRADSSGTTAVFTKHLATINPEFKTALGEGNTVNWPASDKFIKSPKNDGVTATVRQTPGAIGYIEYGFAKLAKVDFAQLQNKAGQYVVPNAESGAEALAAVKMPESLVAWLPDPDGAKSYPITSYTWMIFRKDNGNPAKAKAMREMVEYSLTEGQKIADSMGYIPLPPSVVEQVRKASANIQ